MDRPARGTATHQQRLTAGLGAELPRKPGSTAERQDPRGVALAGDRGVVGAASVVGGGVDEAVGWLDVCLRGRRAGDSRHRGDRALSPLCTASSAAASAPPGISAVGRVPLADPPSWLASHCWWIAVPPSPSTSL